MGRPLFRCALLFVIIIAGNSVFGQNTKKNLLEGDEAFDREAYYTAAAYYNTVVTAAPNNSYAINRLAESYRLAFDYDNAEIWYARLISINPSENPLAPFWYAMMVKMNNKPGDAKKLFEDFINNYKGRDPYYINKARQEADGCVFALEQMKRPVPVIVDNLGPSINSQISDFAPILMNNDSALVFTSSRPGSTGNRIYERTGQVYSDLYRVTQQDSVWQKVENIASVLNQEYNDGTGVFSPDGQKFYFSMCLGTRKVGEECAIFVSTMTNGEWSLPARLNDYVNLPGYWSAQPALSADGKILYFSSNRPGGQGALDIWYSEMDESGGAGETKNMGPEINTIDDDMTPFYYGPTNTLYFSSAGRVGMGGLDVYKCTGTIGNWGPVENLGYPVNSSRDDLSFILAQGSDKWGMLASNRIGGFGSDDIYRFQYLVPKKKIKCAVTGYVIDEETNRSIPGSVVTLYNLDTGEKIGVYKTQADGRYYYDLDLGKNYKLVGSADNYISNFVNVSTGIDSCLIRADINIRLKPYIINRGIVLNNIYYDFDKSTLRPESKLTLDTLVLILKENQNLLIEFGSHCDYHGTDEYNMVLSAARAKSVVDYLVAHGISKKRLTYKGYGETQPYQLICDDIDKYPPGSAAYEDCKKFNDWVAHCDRLVYQSPEDEKCRQWNRRTEFKIKGVIPPEDIDKYNQ